MWEIILLLLAVPCFFVLVSLGWWIGTYNTFKIGKTDIETQWSNIKTEYQRRADLILNLAASVKGYALHEKTTLIEVARARGGMWRGDKATQMQKMERVNNAFMGMMTYQEQYPQLKADANFKQLMEELRITEDRVNIARTDYNELVRQYNINIRTFPKNMIASHYGFTNEVPFDLVDKNADHAPKLDFTT